MTGTLNVTNGYSTVGTMEAVPLPGDFLPWEDVLHQGPVPADLSATELRRVRARYLTESRRDWFLHAFVYLTARDRTLVGAEDVFLWFESDLYDQLQLLQILDLLRDGRGRVRLICIGSFPPEYPDFVGLGQLTPPELASLVGTEHDLSDDELQLGRCAWKAFRSADPTAIEDLLSADTSVLPFLADALVRHLEEFPAVEDGLSSIERMILESVADGVCRWSHIFGRLIELEERPFLDDWTFREYLVNLMTGPTPLLMGEGPFLELWTRLRERKAPSDLYRAAAADELTLSPAGEAVLAGDADFVELNGIDRWFGGVHLTGRAPAWRWSRLERCLVRA